MRKNLNTKTNKLSLIALILSFFVIIQAEDFKKVGTVGYTFLEVPVTARQAGMGQAAGAIVKNSGITPLFLNPAVLGFQKRYVAGISYSKWLANINHHSGGVSIPSQYLGNFGIGVNYFDYGTMDRTIQTGFGLYEKAGNYTAQSLSLGMTYARQLTDKFSYGLRFKWVEETIYNYSSSNALLDMGIIYYTNFNSLRIGGMVSNFGVESKFIGDSFKMPTTLRLALAYDFIINDKQSLTLVGEVSHPSDNLEKIHIGFEYNLNDLLYLRTGYKYKYDEDKISYGAGINWDKFMLDASFIPFGRFNSVYIITFQKGF
ncbi:MAG TPA: PorV/PorQ family protein [bacterium]|nr:PorV/PorQ family protein [bacterium]